MFVYTSLFLPQCLPSSVLFFSFSSLLLSHRHIYSIFSSKSTFLNQHCLLFLHLVLSLPFISTLHWKMFYNRINIDMYLISLSPYNFVIFKDKNHSTHIYNQRRTRRTRYMSPYLQTLLTTTKISLFLSHTVWLSKYIEARRRNLSQKHWRKHVHQSVVIAWLQTLVFVIILSNR